mmetsp:Transcript_10833/g.28015  ORF Transcript_10833/g.28015 Transcript_10833/m.28015 type:complete len:319 (-) Transcript_10833:84-1040(-)|eukprot:CAMPEP_0183389178 /NCGR_PEP_ID=MMETSP0370-20130417/4743_1 /TAXON_ID=268820 /ORGANISM="Peridinium aciculiferum, Strain PAER-2" /LENGTH=318 /DNA_ID=CAMNT_0025568371 /DNA_START=73 /DNA_END=1029 /DNA_ORIENTATION=-
MAGMEVEVLRYHGIPETSVISIRAGSTRRQVNVSSLDRPLKFPGGPDQCGTFKVDVLDLLGSARVAFDPSESEYCLSLDPADESSQRVMEVAFSIRRQGEPRRGGYMSDEGCAGTGDEHSSDERRELNAREYLEKHGLTSFMQFLMQSLMKDKPADPYAFLQRQVSKRMVREVSKRAKSQDGGLDPVLEQTEASAVSTDELAALASEAAMARDQLKEDNRRLKEMTTEMKKRLGVATAEVHSVPASPTHQACPGESPQAVAYREIAKMQEEVMRVARENGKLVEEMSQMRTKMDEARDEIEMLERMEQQQGSGGNPPT